MESFKYITEELVVITNDDNDRLKRDEVLALVGLKNKSLKTRLNMSKAFHLRLKGMELKI